MWTFAFVWAPAVMGWLEVFRWIPLDVPEKPPGWAAPGEGVSCFFRDLNGLEVGPWCEARGFVMLVQLSLADQPRYVVGPTTRTCINVSMYEIGFVI